MFAHGVHGSGKAGAPGLLSRRSGEPWLWGGWLQGGTELARQATPRVCPGVLPAQAQLTRIYSCSEEQAEAAVPAWRELDEALISKGLVAAVTHSRDDSKTDRIQGQSQPCSHHQPVPQTQHRLLSD